MNRIFRNIIILAVLIAGLYGLGRLYFQVTAGFSLDNISSDFAYNPEWEVRPLSASENIEFKRTMGQTYHYLGKGCQSYVFLSDDGNYVIKFFKYQRSRMKPWLTYFPPLPAVVKYREEKKEMKWRKLDGFVKSWKVAFENLKEETGLVYVHLNKTQDLKTALTIYDKIGLKHTVDLDKMEFCVQRKADMLCPTLLKYKENNDLEGAKVLITKLLNRINSEYVRGLGDNDHALMQNTGVANGEPIHIDVGQFVKDDKFKNPLLANQELFTKTFKFKVWLREEYPEAANYLEEQLGIIIGPAYSTMQPKFRLKH